MRWTAKRKAELVRDVRAGKVDLLGFYAISDDEFEAWERLYNAHGEPGLRVTKMRDYKTRDP